MVRSQISIGFRHLDIIFYALSENGEKIDKLKKIDFHDVTASVLYTEYSIISWQHS